MKPRTTAHESDQTRIAMRGHDPQQLDPFVEDLRRAAQDLTAGNQDVKRRAAAAFEKVVGALEQARRVGG